MIQQSHFWVFIQKKLAQDHKKGICTPMLISARFMIAKIGNNNLSTNG